jgi:hypothetical protein
MDSVDLRLTNPARNLGSRSRGRTIARLDLVPKRDARSRDGDRGKFQDMPDLDYKHVIGWRRILP